mmetsp:Transcript_6290/g.19735  ORF Transcript_6290/g.19735 Transcript_6290/m.19735 type:complete len:84 (-) Transcript_6290:57-308(-)
MSSATSIDIRTAPTEQLSVLQEQLKHDLNMCAESVQKLQQAVGEKRKRVTHAHSIRSITSCPPRRASTFELHLPNNSRYCKSN